MNYDKLNKEQNKAWLNDLKNYFRMINETSRCHMFINILDLMVNSGLIYTKKLEIYEEKISIRVEGVDKFWIEKKTHPNKESCYTVFIQDDEIGKTVELLRYYPNKLISWDEEFSEDDIIVHNECFNPTSKTNRLILDKIGKVLELSNENDNSIGLYNVEKFLKQLEKLIKNKWRIIELCEDDFDNYFVLVEFHDDPNFKIIIKIEDNKKSYFFCTIDSEVRFFKWDGQVPDLTLWINKDENPDVFYYKNRFNVKVRNMNIKNSYEARRLFELLSKFEKEIPS